MERKNTLLLTVIAVATLLVAVVGATFAYFASTYTQSGDNQTVNVTTKTVTNVTYETGSEIKLENMDLPVGTKNNYVRAAEGIFNVRALGSSDADTVSYNIGLTVTTNTIKDATEKGAQGNVACKLYRGTTAANVALVTNENDGFFNCDADLTNLLGATKESFAVLANGPETGLYYKLEVYVWNANVVDNTIQNRAYSATLNVNALTTANNNGAQGVTP